MSYKTKLTGLLKEKEKLILKAPFTGQVRDSMRDLRSGDWLDEATPIARVVLPNTRLVFGYVHEDDLWQVSVGLPASFIPEDPLISRRFGKIIEISHVGSRQLDIHYLSSIFGGAIASDKNDKGEIRPRASYYLVKAEISGPSMERVVRGTLHVAGRPESLAFRAWRRVSQVLIRESGI